MNTGDWRDPEFDAYAENYDAALHRGLALSGERKEFFARDRMAWLARCLAARGWRPRTALDFGCGTGTSVPLLLGLEGMESVTGVDVSPRSLQIARRLHGSERARFLLISEFTPDARCDLAFCNGVFHHIPPAERGDAVRWVFRSLRSGGYFALWENNPWNPGARWVMSRIPFDRDAILLAPPESRRLLAAGGFDVARSSSLFFFPRALAWFRPLERLLRNFPLGAQYLTLGRKR